MFALLLAACAPSSGNATPEMPEPGQPEEATDIPAPTDSSKPVPNAVTAALAFLAKQMDVPESDIEVVKVESMQWPDGCLGAAQPDEMCTQAIVDGYRIILSVDGREYEFHTDSQGIQVRQVQAEDEGEGEVVGETLPAVVNARQFLAQHLGVAASEIKLVKVEEVDWPNSCLGVEKKNQMCADVITPGYLVLLESGGNQYEIHTDQTGGVVLLAETPFIQEDGTALAWEWIEENVCQRLEFHEGAFWYGGCQYELTLANVSQARLEEMQEFITTFASFESKTPAGQISFSGQGEQNASGSEQRSMGEWAGLVYQEAESGRDDEGLGEVMVWHREGGIAGFCDDLVVYSSGWAYSSSCKAGASERENGTRLSGEQLDQLYTWVDAYQSFEVVQDDPPGAADAMAITFAFTGTGDSDVPANVQEEMLLFAGDLFSKTTR
jgi:hypothetical protein